MHPEEIKQQIENTLPNSTAFIQSDDGTHYTAIIISPHFAEKTRIQRQQAVNTALKHFIDDGTIHAISMKTFTPDEWHTQNARNTP